MVPGLSRDRHIWRSRDCVGIVGKSDFTINIFLQAKWRLDCACFGGKTESQTRVQRVLNGCLLVSIARRKCVEPSNRMILSVIRVIFYSLSPPSACSRRDVCHLQAKVYARSTG